MKNITSITIHWAESFLVEEETVFTSLLEANILLMRLAEADRGKEGYCKVKFTAKFEDGEEYTGRFDVHGMDKKQETTNGALCFLQHMKDHVSFLSGKRKPDHMTVEQYESCVDRSNEIQEWVARLGC